MDHQLNQIRHIQSFFKRTCPIFLIFLCLMAGLLPRISTIGSWNSEANYLIMDNTPLLTNLDGYYYLDSARELLQGTYSKLDQRRAYPAGHPRPQPAPLLSVMVATISAMTGLSLDWIAAFIPVILSFSMAIPLYYFARMWGGRIMVYTSVLFGLTAYGYITRTSLGFFDTDCLNVTFPLIIAYCALRFAQIKTPKRYYRLLFAGFFAALYLWWWNISLAAATALSLWPILIALLFFYRPSRKEGICFAAILVCLIATLTYFIPVEQGQQLIKDLYNHFLYITKQNSVNAIFPNTSISNMEQESLNFSEIAQATTSYSYLMVLSLVGFLGLFYRNWKETVFLLPVIIVGLFSFTAIRFNIFLNPITALGIGFLAQQLAEKITQKSIAIAVIGFIIGSHLYQTLSSPPERKSLYPAQTLSVMKDIDDLTPTNSVIYSWWDEGHPLLYWSKRSVMADGMIHSGERVVYLAFPMASDNFKLAANYIQFFSTHGLAGIHKFIAATHKDQKDGFKLLQEILEKGPASSKPLIKKHLPQEYEQNKDIASWQAFLFPADAPPIYLFIDERLLYSISRWIHWFGTWDSSLQQGNKTLRTVLFKLPKSYDFGDFGDNSSDSSDNSTFAVNRELGQLKVPDVFTDSLYLSQISSHTKEEITIDYYPQNNPLKQVPPIINVRKVNLSEQNLYTEKGAYVLQIFKNAQLAYLIDENRSKTLLSQLFLFKNENEYFTLIAETYGFAQLWKVSGEKFTKGTNQ